MNIETLYLECCTSTLAKAQALLLQADPKDMEYEMYPSACVHDPFGFFSRNVLTSLKPYFHSSKPVDDLKFKDVFRHAVLCNIITDEACERCLQYRDNRNNTAHHYGSDFAQKTLVFLPQFIEDATTLVAAIQKQNTD